MNKLTIKNETLISGKYDSKYNGIAFDGCYFYFTCTNICEIIKYDICFCEVGCYKTKRVYNSICYDNKENCFWAASERNPCKVFKLDSKFMEIDCLMVCQYNNCDGIIVGVSYDCQSHSLVIAFTNRIVQMDTLDCTKQRILQKGCCEVNIGVVSIAPDYILTTIQGKTQSISIYGCEDEVKEKYEVPPEYYVRSILFYPCKTECETKYVCYILAVKNCGHTYLLEWEMNAASLNINECNFCICHRDCEEKPCPSPTPSCNDIIESIAIMEMALAHILNAEGEKLQKVIAGTKDINKILEVNKVVNQVVVDVTHLEIALYDKLALVKEICKICGECPKECSKECFCEKRY
ncbi:MAG: hypothetical protein RSB37_00890 [Acetivibrio sp.]